MRSHGGGQCGLHIPINVYVCHVNVFRASICWQFAFVDLPFFFCHFLRLLLSLLRFFLWVYIDYGYFFQLSALIFCLFFFFFTHRQACWMETSVQWMAMTFRLDGNGMRCDSCKEYTIIEVETMIGIWKQTTKMICWTVPDDDCCQIWNLIHISAIGFPAKNKPSEKCLKKTTSVSHGVRRWVTILF